MLVRFLRARGLAALFVAASALGCGSADEASAPGAKQCGKVVVDGGGGITKPADGSTAPECAAGACNFQSQAGCGADESCLPTVNDDGVGAACFAAGSVAVGDACDANAVADCERGAVCAEGQCRKLCCAGDWSVCDAGESCFRQFEYQVGDAAVPTGAWVCYPVGTCSVLDTYACDDTGEDCKLVDSRGSEACVPKTAGAVGEACGASQNRLCERGLTCVGDPGAETCRRLCSAEACGEPACPAAEGSCVHFDRDPAAVGECTPGW
jgi:hypothetical protein